MKNPVQHNENQKNHQQAIHKIDSVPTPNREQNEARPSAEAAMNSTDGEIDYGDMNLADAQESGYTDENGNAVDRARSDRDDESPTGALTDIGSGRSSVVKKQSEIKKPEQRN